MIFIRKHIYEKCIGYSLSHDIHYYESLCEMSDGLTKMMYGQIGKNGTEVWTEGKPPIALPLPYPMDEVDPKIPEKLSNEERFAIEMWANMATCKCGHLRREHSRFIHGMFSGCQHGICTCECFEWPTEEKETVTDQEIEVMLDAQAVKDIQTMLEVLAGYFTSETEIKPIPRGLCVYRVSGQGAALGAHIKIQLHHFFGMVGYNKDQDLLVYWSLKKEIDLLKGEKIKC
jgi:hypothetical protein